MGGRPHLLEVWKNKMKGAEFGREKKLCGDAGLFSSPEMQKTLLLIKGVLERQIYFKLSKAGEIFNGEKAFL